MTEHVCLFTKFANFLSIIPSFSSGYFSNNLSEIVNPKTQEDRNNRLKVEEKFEKGVYAYIKIDTELKELTYFDFEEETISWSSYGYANRKQTYSNLEITNDFYKIKTKYINDLGIIIDTIDIVIKINRKTGYSIYRYLYDGTGPTQGQHRKLIRYLCLPTGQLF